MRYEATIRIINSVIGMTGLLLLNFVFGPSLLINAIAISVIPFINLCARYLFLRRLRLDLNIRLVKSFRLQVKPILRISSVFGIWAVFSLGFNQGIVILVGLIQGEVAAAIYRVSYTLAGFIALLVTALWAVLYPALSKYVARKKGMEFTKLFINILKTVLFFSFLIISVYWLLSDYLIALIYGSKYFGVEVTSRVLAVGIFFQIVYTPFEIALATLNRQKSNTIVLIMSVLISFAITIILVLFIGVFSSFAAAISVVFAQLIHLVILLLMSKSGNELDYSIPIRWGLMGLSFTILLLPVEFLRVLPIPISVKLALWLLGFVLYSFAIRLVSFKEIEDSLKILRLNTSW
jgi:O-antigen/teichoic acid export membrane protein